MFDGFFRVTHVFGEAAIHIVLEPINVVFFAHPVLTRLAKAAFPARNDLLGDDPASELKFSLFLDVSAELDHGSDDLVPRHHGRLVELRLTVPTPERFGPDA